MKENTLESRVLKLWITVDVEEDYHFHHIHGGDPTESKKKTIEKPLELILDLFEDLNVRGTFFVVGDISKKYSSLLKRAARRHEIGCHSLSHSAINRMNDRMFHRDTERAVGAIEDATGAEVRGYRAPSWSLPYGKSWFYRILEEFKFSYSSSLFPIKTPFYGVRNGPILPFHPTSESGSRHSIIEIPAPVFATRIARIPFCGGWYLRNLPTSIDRALHEWFANKYGASMLYFHPGDFELDSSPKYKRSFKQTVLDLGKKSAFQKVKHLIKNSQSLTSSEYIAALSHRNPTE